MNQPVSALQGASPLLDLGTPAATGVAASPSGAGGEASFNLLIAKAATDQQVADGNSVPQDGEKLPSASAGEAEAGEASGGAVATPDAGMAAEDVTDGPDVGAVSGEVAGAVDVDGAGSQRARIDVTPEQIGEYRKADISVAVGSVLQQYRDSGAGQPPATVAGDGTVAAPVAATAGEAQLQQAGQASGRGVPSDAPVMTVAAVPQRGDADLAAQRQVPGGSSEQGGGQLNGDERVAAIAALARAGQQSSGQTSEQRLAEQRVATDKSAAAGGAGAPDLAAVTDAVPAQGPSGAPGRAVSQAAQQADTPSLSQIINQASVASAQSAAESERGAERAVPVAGQVRSASGDEAAVSVAPVARGVETQSSTELLAAVVPGVDGARPESGLPAASPVVIQAVADKLRDQVQSAVAGQDKAGVAEQRVLPAQPINRETAQVIGDGKSETPRAVLQPQESIGATRSELATGLSSRESAGGVADSVGGSRADAAAVEKSLSGFAESLAAAGKTTRAAAETQQMTMPAGVKPGMPAWNQAVNNRVMMLSSQNGRFAEIQLDPPELGSLQVKLQVKNEQVSVVFSTPHAVVKDALEQGMPRLKEMFEQQGMSLADSSVEDQGQERHSDGDDERGYGGSQLAGSEASESESPSAAVGDAVSLVDYYA